MMNKLMNRIKISAHFGWEIVKYALLCPIGKLLYGRKNVWLISERGTDARDNGYHFFRYMRKKHPEVESVFVISKDSPDRSRVAALGRVVDYRSIRHYMLFFGAQYLISTHLMGYAPNCDFYKYIQAKMKKKVVGGKSVFLQHGITKDNMVNLYQEKTKLDLFICGAKPEYMYISQNWHYQHGEVCYTGFARFDALTDYQTKRQILMMPTWRNWLEYGVDACEKNTMESSFFRHWKSLLNNSRLLELANEYNVQFVFYPHYRVQKYLSAFSTASSEIILADFAHYDVQQLLKESMLLITDYSSVYFDFAYMKKPVLYYQFDEEEYRAKHYAQGYYDYRRDGFGEVVNDEQELLDLLEHYLSDGCRLKPEYQKRIEGFFPLHDNQNCERIYQAILAEKNRWVDEHV